MDKNSTFGKQVELLKEPQMYHHACTANEKTKKQIKRAKLLGVYQVSSVSTCTNEAIK